MVQRRTLLLGVIALICCAATTTAQVTIGSDIVPTKAALLELKTQQANTDNATSTTGGLLLPRVKLVELTTFEPFISTSDEDWTNTTKKDSIRRVLKGLMVYNVGTGNGLVEGVLVWTGAAWEKVGGGGTTVHPWLQPVATKTLLSDVHATHADTVIATAARVTIGAKNIDAHKFSLLELAGNSGGFRLPQLSTQQRNDLQTTFGAKATTEARGLQIFNTTTNCVDTWNGTAWIQQCYGSNTPGTAEPVSPMTPTDCGVTPNDERTVWTAILDPNAEKYEFFVYHYDGISYEYVSQGKQAGNVLTLSTPPPYDVRVKYYYPLSFLKPTMLSIPGNNREWYYGVDGTPTSAAIPGFKMSETPVTQAQFEYVMGFNESPYKCSGGKDRNPPASALPMDVSWNAAITYCNKLSLLEGKTPVYSVGGINDWAALTEDYQIPNYRVDNWCAVTCNFAANGYRLPTASEWEYAAHGDYANGSANYVFAGSNYYSGIIDFDIMNEDELNEARDSLSLVAWFRDPRGNSGSGNSNYYYNDSPKPVKTKRANFFGLYDMSGNIDEFCWDIADANAPYPAATPTGIVNSVDPLDIYRRVVRGGNYSQEDLLYFTVFAPYHSDIDLISDGSRNQFGGSDAGFRVVCSGR